MSHSRYEKNRHWKPGNLAAILVEYENLHQLLSERLDENVHPDEYITEMLDELLRYLNGRDFTQTVIFNAYANFDKLNGDGLFIQQSLTRQAIAPHFVTNDFNQSSAELQLAVDALDTAVLRPDIQTFALITGDRLFLPLVQKLRQHGRNVIVVTVDRPNVADWSAYRDSDIFLSAMELLSESSRRQIRGGASEDVGGRSGNYGRRTSSTRIAPTRDVNYKDITDEVAHRTLRIIEEHFGQYDEVYLTPLLRKLSESLIEEDQDPKSIINLLEDGGAVWLEKRRGFPYDYTVLIVDSEHPDVIKIQEELKESGSYGNGTYSGSYGDDTGDSFEAEEEFATDESFSDAPYDEDEEEENA